MIEELKKEQAKYGKAIRVVTTLTNALNNDYKRGNVTLDELKEARAYIRAAQRSLSNELSMLEKRIKRITREADSQKNS